MLADRENFGKRLRTRRVRGSTELTKNG